jgi:hypothetical protein
MRRGSSIGPFWDMPTKPTIRVSAMASAVETCSAIAA